MNKDFFSKYIQTEKQRQFDTDFFKNAESYEVWEEIDFSNLTEVEGEQEFEIKAEDMKYFAEAVMDDNPLLMDEEYAKSSPHGQLMAHPVFVTQIIFWCIGTRGRGNWIRTPGARNPGQQIEMYEDFHVGEMIHIKMKPYDRYIKRGKYYLRYQIDLYNQDEVKKATAIGTLILPKSRDDIRKFLKGLRGLDV
ncbi:MAG: MaoC family dehydratase [Syntrophales bacterium]|jgi:acyl dehydratase